MNENESAVLTAKIEQCNKNIVRFAKEYVSDYLCDEMDAETVDLPKAVEIAEKTNLGDNPSKSELAEFGILLFWLNVRKIYSQKLLAIFTEEAC